MGAIVTFDYAGFARLFPELEYVSPDLVAVYFDIATTMHANDGTGPVADAAQQSKLLNFLTAHLSKLYAPNNGQAPSGLVGRISSATEGSVTVQAEWGSNTSERAAWFLQTQYGATYWAMTAQFRTMRYRPGYPRPVNPWARGLG